MQSPQLEYVPTASELVFDKKNVTQGHSALRMQRRVVCSDLLQFNKNVLEENLACQLRNIEEERELLNRREERLRAKTVEDDRENKLMMGLLLEESLEQIFKTEGAHPETERGWSRMGNKCASFGQFVCGWVRDRLAKDASVFRLAIIGISCFILVFLWVLVRRFMYVTGML